MQETILLPLGTVFKPKDLQPGWGQFRLMITGYFPISKDTGECCYDYVVAPWPLGYVNVKGRGQVSFLQYSDASIEEVEYLGCISQAWRETVEKYVETANEMKLVPPVFESESPWALRLDTETETFSRKGGEMGTLLPLGSVVSVAAEGGRTMMLCRHKLRISATNEVKDYAAVFWPQGDNPADEGVYLVNNEEISAVHFRGYENAFSQKLARQLFKSSKRSLFSRIAGKVG